MATSSSSPSRSPASAAAASPPDWIAPLRDRFLNATIFGINRLSIRDRPKNILKCLEVDRYDQSRSGQLYRQLYLSDGLAKTDHMYTTDVMGHHGCVNTLALSNTGEEFLVSAGDDQRVLVWRVADMIQAGSRSPKPIVMTSQHSSNVFTANFSCDNQYIYSGGDDFELIKHDFNTGQPISCHEHLDAVYSTAPHPSCPSIVLTASEDGCVYTIDTRQPHRRVDYEMVLCEASEAYHCAVFNPVEPRLVAVCNSHTGTALYDTRQKKRLVRYKCTTWPIVREDAVSACFDSTGQQLYVMHRMLPPCLYELWDEEARLSFMDNTGSYKNTVTMKSGCFMGQNDEYVVSGSDDFRVYIWKIPNTRRGTEVYLGEGVLTMNMSTMPHLILPGHRSIVNQACYSKVHHILATSGVEKVIKVWSHERLNSSQKISQSRAPPSRTRYSLSELDRLMNVSPVDPLAEDPSVLALFDSLLEEGENPSDYYDSSSTDDEEDDDDSDDPYLMDDERRLRHVLLHLPFGGIFNFSHDEDDGDATPTDSELSFANTSSLEPPWSSEDDMDDVDEELRVVYGSDVADWGSSDSDSSCSDLSTRGEEDGRAGRISNHHDDEEDKKDNRNRSKTKDRTLKTEGASSSQSEPNLVARESIWVVPSQSEPTRSQPSRKAKKVTTAAEGNGGCSSAVASNCQPKPQKDGSSKNKRQQPKRKVKSAQANTSAATRAMNSEPLVSCSSSSLGESSKSGSGARAVANGNGGITSSGHGSRAVANGNGETTNRGSGPSRRWTRKRNRREQQASGTTANNYEQYHVEDFLRPKSPTSFYAKKKDPP